jgi:hypothetical protein
MPINYKKNVVHFDGVISVEDAEELLGWIQKNPKSKVDFSRCTHLHAANLQVLMVARLAISAWPQDKTLKTWLTAALATST